MKNRNRFYYFGLFLIFLLYPVSSVASQAQLPPDQVQTALNLLTIECQNLSDYAVRAAQGDFSGYETTKRQFSVTIDNIGSIFGNFTPDMVNVLWDQYNNFNPDAASASETATKCQEVRQIIYQQLAEVDGILNPPQSVTNFEECVAAGYFVDEGTCFIGGYPVYDEAGYFTGLYNANCFDTQDSYQGTCWYCAYGNTADGCNPRP